MKYQVYANGKPIKKPFDKKEIAKVNMALLSYLNPNVKFTLKEIGE